MTAFISTASGAVVHNEPAFMDIRAWRGDDLVLPLTFMDDQKIVTDATVVHGGTTLFSPSAPFVSGDATAAICGDGIPFGATIATFTNSQHVILSAAATKSKQFSTALWGPSQDVSGWTISAQVRSHPDSAKVLANFTIDASQSASGLVTATIPTGIMKGLPGGRLSWDLQRITAAVERTLFAGAFIVLPDTTRP